MTESPGVLFERLLDVMMRLRAPRGCPWDREQTRTSLKPYLIEEAYEVLEAIESGRSAPLREELGDLLFQVVFHARLAEELGEFTMRDLLQQLIDKMVRRHPHVFGDASVGTATEALAQWEAIKQREADERGLRRSLLDGVPRALPALLRAVRRSPRWRPTSSSARGKQRKLMSAVRHGHEAPDRSVVHCDRAGRHH